MSGRTGHISSLNLETKMPLDTIAKRMDTRASHHLRWSTKIKMLVGKPNQAARRKYLNQLIVQSHVRKKAKKNHPRDQM
jgi:hypothetical protein